MPPTKKAAPRRSTRKRKRPEKLYDAYESDEEINEGVPQSKKEKGPFGLEWTTKDTCYILTSKELKGSKKIAAFDMVN